MTTRPGFTIWDVTNVDLPLAHKSVRPGSQSAYVRRGMSPGEGPGLIVNSFDPDSLIRVEEHPAHSQISFSLRCLVGLASDGIGEITSLLAGLEGVSVREIAQRTSGDLTQFYPLRDSVMRIDGTWVPAIRLELGAPDLTVMVSANLLSHPVQVTAWQCALRPYPSMTSTEG